jgi:hypothetical protein
MGGEILFFNERNGLYALNKFEGVEPNSTKFNKWL